MFIRIAIPLVLLAIIAFGAVKAMPLILGPALRIDSPTDGASSTDGFVTVAGIAWRTDSLTLDGAPLLPEADGHFSKLLVLPEGQAILSLTAADRFGRSVTLHRTVSVP
jgi:hypothetical protein